MTFWSIIKHKNRIFTHLGFLTIKIEVQIFFLSSNAIRTLRISNLYYEYKDSSLSIIFNAGISIFYYILGAYVQNQKYIFKNLMEYLFT